MYINLGADKLIRSDELIGIFDIDNCSTGKRTRNFLSAAQNEGRIVDATDDLPRTFIVTASGKVCISAVSTATLKRRITE